MGKYPVITLCGSTRFKDEFEQLNRELTLAGNVVLSVSCFDRAENGENGLTEEQQKMMDEIHWAKIDLADGIFVINKNGYIGESTRNDILYARRKHKLIRFLEPPSEEYVRMTYTWEDFHALPFEVRKAVRDFRKPGKDYSDNSEVWNELPENEIDRETFKKAVHLYDSLLS